MTTGALGQSLEMQGFAEAEVLSALSIHRESDLDFGLGLVGDPAKTVSPAEGARFEVRGEPEHTFEVLLPHRIALTRQGPGLGHKTLSVARFTSWPAWTGQLDKGGSRTLLVGAQRERIRPQQPAGDYLGSFTVTVAYP